MALDLEVKTLDELPEAIKGEYEQVGDVFRLMVSGLPDASKLEGALHKERENRKTLEAKLKEIEEAKKKAEEAAEEAARQKALKAGDTEAIVKSWEEKYNKSLAELNEKIKSRESTIVSLTVETAARKLAADLAVEGCAEALYPHIRSRLSYEMEDNNVNIVVLGRDGKPSALKFEELNTDIATIDYLKPLLKGSKASGTGAKPSGGSAGGTLYRDKMTAEQKLEYQSKHGQEAYLKLPKSEKAG